MDKIIYSIYSTYSSAVPACILHNALEKGSDSLTVDIETIVLKIGSNFENQTSRAVSLKQFCEQLDSNYSTLLNHTSTRCKWTTVTTLDSALERMINFWQPLKVHFLSLKRPSRILMNFFDSDKSLVVVAFLHNALLLC